MGQPSERTHCAQSIIQVLLLLPWPKKGEEEDQQCGTDGSRTTANVGEGKSHTCSEERGGKGGDRRRATPKRGERERGKAHSTHLRAERFLPPPPPPLIPPTPVLGERERGNKSQLFPVVGSPPPPQCMCVHARPFLLSVSPTTTTKSLLKGEIQQCNRTFHPKKSSSNCVRKPSYLFVSDTVSCF